MITAPPLHLAAVYRRDVGASLARIWENVFDWEHLAHLHDGSFATCGLIDRGTWGWRVTLATMTKPEDLQVIELRADRAAGRYVSTMLEGAGAGTEIRVALAARDPQRTGVVVEFHVPEARSDRLAAIGAAYSAAYARLWDEDEAMMQRRERMLRRPNVDATVVPVDLGSEDEVRAALPLGFAFAGRPFRLIDLAGTLIAHSSVCPHWLGPLDDAPVADGTVRCPWHGYRFDVGTGVCVSHNAPLLARPPVIHIEDGSVFARAV